MDIESLGRYYPTFYHDSRGDGAIDSGNDRYEYYDYPNNSAARDKNNDQKIDFWEYLEATAPWAVKDVQKNDILDYSARVVFERAQKENKDLLYLYAHQREDRSLLPLLSDASKKELVLSALRGINHGDANIRKNSVLVLGDLYMVTADENLRVSILDHLIFKASESDEVVRGQAIKALSGIYGKLGSINKKEKQYILDIVMTGANDIKSKNAAPNEASILFLAENYRVIISDDQAMQNKIIDLLLSIIEPQKKAPETNSDYDSRNREENTETKQKKERVEKAAIMAIIDIYKNHGISDKYLHDRMIETLIYRVSQDLTNREKALQFMEYIYKTSSDAKLRIKIYEGCSFLDEFVADTFHLIKDRAKRAEIVRSMCESYTSSWQKGTLGSSLEKIYKNLGSSEEKLKQQIMALGICSVDDEFGYSSPALTGLLPDNYLNAKPEDVEQRKKSLNCIIANSGVNGIFALYKVLRSRGTKEVNELIGLLTEELSNISATGYMALSKIYFDTSDASIKIKIQDKMLKSLSAAKYVNDSLGNFFFEIGSSTKASAVDRKALDTLLAMAARSNENMGGKSTDEMNIIYDSANKADNILMRIHSVTLDKELKKKIEQAIGMKLYMAYLDSYAFPGEFTDRVQWMDAVELSIQAKFTLNELQNYRSVESGGMSGNFESYVTVLAAYYRTGDDEAIKRRILEKYRAIMQEQMERGYCCNIFENEFRQVGRFGTSSINSLNFLMPRLDELYGSTKDERIHESILDAVLCGIGGVEMSQEETSERIIRRLFEKNGGECPGIKAKLVNKIIEENKKYLSSPHSGESPSLGTANAALLSMCYSDLNSDTDADLKKIILSLFCEHVSKDNLNGQLDLLLPVFSAIGSLDIATQENVVKVIIENVNRGSEEAANVLIHMFNENQPAQKQTRSMIIKKLIEYSLLENVSFNQNLIWAEGYMYASMDKGEKEQKEMLLKAILKSANRSNDDAATEVLKGIFLQLSPEDNVLIEDVIIKLCDLQALDAFKSVLYKALVKVNDACRKTLIEKSFEISVKKEDFVRVPLLMILYVNLRPGDERQMKLKILESFLSMSDIYGNFNPEAVKAITDIYDCLIREGDSYLENYLIGRIIGMSKNNNPAERSKSIKILDAIYWRFPEKKGLRLKIVDIIFGLSDDGEYRVKEDAKWAIQKALKEGGREFFFRQVDKYKDATNIPDFFVDQMKDSESAFKIEAARLFVRALNDKREVEAVASISSILEDYSVHESVKGYLFLSLYEKYRSAGAKIKMKIFDLLLIRGNFERLEDIKTQKAIIDVALADENKLGKVMELLASYLSTYNLNSTDSLNVDQSARTYIVRALYQKYRKTDNIAIKEKIYPILLDANYFKALDDCRIQAEIIDRALADEMSAASVTGKVIGFCTAWSMADDIKEMIVSKLWDRMMTAKDVYLKDYICSMLVKIDIFKKLDSTDKQKYILDKGLSILKLSESPDVLMNVSDHLSAIMGDEDIEIAIRAKILGTFISFVMEPASYAFYSKKYKQDDYEGLLLKGRLATAICENAIGGIKGLKDVKQKNERLAAVISKAEEYKRAKDRGLQDMASILISKSIKLFVNAEDPEASGIDKLLLERIKKLDTRPKGPSRHIYEDGKIKVKIYFQEYMKEIMWVNELYLNKNHGFKLEYYIVQDVKLEYSLEEMKALMKKENASGAVERIIRLQKDSKRLAVLFSFLKANSGKKFKTGSLTIEQKEQLEDLLAMGLIKERGFSKTSSKKAKIIDKEGNIKEVYLIAEVAVPRAPRGYSDFDQHIFNELTEDSDIDYIIYNGHAGMTHTLNTSFENAKAYYREAIIQLSNCWSRSHLPEIQQKFRYAHPILTKEGAYSLDGCIIFGSTLESMLEKGIDTNYADIRKAIDKNLYNISTEKVKGQIVPGNFFFISDDYFAQISDVDGDGVPDRIDDQYTFNVVVHFNDYFDTVFRPTSNAATPQGKALAVYNYFRPSFDGDPTFLANINFEIDPDTQGVYKGWFSLEKDTKDSVILRQDSNREDSRPSYFVQFNLGYANCSETALRVMSIFESALKMADLRSSEALQVKTLLDKVLFNEKQNENGVEDAKKSEAKALELLGLARSDITSAYERLGIAKDAEKQLLLVNTARAFLLAAEEIEKYNKYLPPTATQEERSNAKRLYDDFIITYNLPRVSFDKCLKILDLSDNAAIMWYIAYLAKNNVPLPENYGKRIEPSTQNR